MKHLKLFVAILFLVAGSANAVDGLEPQEGAYIPSTTAPKLHTIERSESAKMQANLNCEQSGAAETFARLVQQHEVNTDLTFQEACVVNRVLNYAAANPAALAEAQ